VPVVVRAFHPALHVPVKEAEPLSASMWFERFETKQAKAAPSGGYALDLFDDAIRL